VHGLPVRKDAAVAENFGIYPRLIGGAAAGNAGATVERLKVERCTIILTASFRFAV
jgi:hypothetical protein